MPRLRCNARAARRAGLPELTVTQSPDGDGLLVTSSPSASLSFETRAALRFTPASGAPETLELPRAVVTRPLPTVFQYGPVDLSALGVAEAELVLFVDGFEAPFVNAGEVVTSVTLSDGN